MSEAREAAGRPPSLLSCPVCGGSNETMRFRCLRCRRQARRWGRVAAVGEAEERN